MEKICLFGGSFDPVHEGHLFIAKAAYEKCELDKIIFLPAACSPFKQEHEHYFSNEQRLNLLEEATQAYPWASVSTLDLKLPPPSWSWRIVEQFTRLHPNAKLYWLMGLDQWKELERWAHYDKLIETLHFIVHHRNGGEPQARAGVEATFIAGHHPASSSAIRAELLDKAGKKTL